MKSKTLGMLAGITIIGILVAFLVNREPASRLPNSGDLLFPQLLSIVNEVHEFVVETNDQTVTLVRGPDAWGVKEKAGYRADVEKVKQAIIGLAELRILEPKTRNPELYDRLGVQDTDQEGSPSKAVTVKTPDIPEAALVIVGNQRPAKGNPRMSEIYVRRPGDPQTWLVTGNLPLEHVPEEWLDKEIVAIPAKRVHRATVTHPEGDTLLLFKDKPDELDFQLDSVPPGFKVASQFAVNNVVGTLAQLELEDVKKKEDTNFEHQPGVSAVLETFDGLRLRVHTAQEGDKIFAKISAEFDPALVVSPEADPDSEKEDTAQPSASGQDDTAPESTEEKPLAEHQSMPSPGDDPVVKNPEEVQKEVEELTQRVQGWAYELPAFRVENFSKVKDDLLEKIP
jgi:hypothetical protein